MQLKLKDPTSTFQIIVPWDPAIDVEKSDLKAYLNDLDQKHLVFFSGKSPSIIHLLPASKWLVTNVIEAGSQASKMQTDLARHSIQKITSLDNHLLDLDMAEALPSPIAVWQPANKIDQTTMGRGILYSTSQEFLAFNLKTIQFVATVVQANAFLVPGIKQPYQALLSLWEV